MATSTPNNTRELPEDTDISIIPPQEELPVTISDDEVDEALRVLSNECHQHDVDVHEQSTLRLDTPNHSQSQRNYSSLSELIANDQIKKVHFDQTLENQSKTSATNESEIIRSENTVTVICDNPTKQTLTPRQELASTSRIRSVSPVAVENLDANNETDNSTSDEKESRSPREEPTFKVFIQKNSRNEGEKPKAEEIQKSGDKRNWSIPQNTPLPTGSQSSISSCEFDIPKCAENDVCLENFPIKRLDISVSNEEVGSKDCQCQCFCKTGELSNLQPEIRFQNCPKSSLSLSVNKDEFASQDCQCKCSCAADELNNIESTTTEGLAAEQSQRWVISPEEIKKSLEAIRQSFLNKVEDNANILYKSLVYPPCAQTSTGNKCDFCELNIGREKNKEGLPQNNQGAQNNDIQQTMEDSPKSSNHLQPVSVDLDKKIYVKDKKSVSVQILSKSNICRKCELAGRSADCKGGENGCHGTNFKTKDPTTAKNSQGTESQKSTKADICRKCEMAGRGADCKGIENGCHGTNFEIKDPTTTENSQGTESQKSTKANICRKCELAGRGADCNEVWNGCHRTNFEIKDLKTTDKSQGTESLKSNKTNVCRKCELAGQSEDCKGGENRFHVTNVEVKDSKTTDKSQDTESLRATKANICLKCEQAGRSANCKAGEKGCHGTNYDAKDPEKVDKCQGTELQLFKDLNALPKHIETIDKPCNICDPIATCKETQGSSLGLEDIEKQNFLNLLKDKPFSEIRDFNIRKQSVNMQVREVGAKCDFCENSKPCEEIVDGCQEKHRGSPEPGDSGKSLNAKLQILDNDSALESRTVSPRSEDRRDSPPKLRKILEVKIVKKELREDSGGSSCRAGCERYYRDKLMATLQILENKDETIRIQGSSLGVAECRIAELSKRAGALQAELEHKARELSKLRQFADSCRVDKSDASIMAEVQDAEGQRRVIQTLEDNLAVIADLYRECFYETAKQEELIELLRKSYLDVRLMERDKTDRITRLENVIVTQKRSIEQCQDVVVEVESLKSEISSFLNSSNNDSGVWERGSESGDVGEELADILDQLRQLQDLLTGDCACGREEENRTLKERNTALEAQLDRMKERNQELDGALRQLLDQQYERKIQEKERELQEALTRLAEAEKAGSSETLTRQLLQSQVMLNDKSAELVEAQRACAAHAATVQRLQQELETSEQLVTEGAKKLEEASRSQVGQQMESQMLMMDLERRLQRVTQRCHDLEMSCREKQRSLEEAQARGARLCEESRRVTRCVRLWMRRQRLHTREQQEKIEMQESMLRDLQRRVVAGRRMPDLTSQSETEPGSSGSLHRITSDTSYPRCSRINQATCRSEMAFSRCGPSLARCERDRETSCSKCESNRQGGSERARCSRESASGTARCAQAPVPPRRQKKKQQPDDGQEWASPPRACCGPALAQRVQLLHDALRRGQRRWGRPRR